VQDSVEWLWHDSQLIRLVDAFNAAMFPEDWTPPAPPTAAERNDVQQQARASLLRALPDVLVTLVGTANARRGVGKLFDALQSTAMNKRLLYTLLEALLSALFPELAQRDLQLVTVPPPPPARRGLLLPDVSSIWPCAPAQLLYTSTFHPHACTYTLSHTHKLAHKRSNGHHKP